MSDYSPGQYRNERQVPNEMSKRSATHNREPWSQDDDEMLLEFWLLVTPCTRDEADIAAALGRTIEACRNRAHHLRVVFGIDAKFTTEVEVSPSRLVAWDDDDPNAPTWYVR